MVLKRVKRSQRTQSNKLIFKIQQKFKSERKVKEINNVAFSLNDDKRMLSIDLAKTFSYRVEI